MHAVCEYLFRQLDLQKPGASRAPTRRFGAGEVGYPPDQRLDVLDEMVATEIGLEVVFEKPQLAGKTRLRAPNETARQPASPACQFLHPYDNPDGQCVTAPAVLPGAPPPLWIGVHPGIDETNPKRVIHLFQVLHVVEVHAPKLILRRRSRRAKIDVGNRQRLSLP